MQTFRLVRSKRRGRTADGRKRHTGADDNGLSAIKWFYIGTAYVG